MLAKHLLIKQYKTKSPVWFMRSRGPVGIEKSLNKPVNIKKSTFETWNL